MNGFAGGIVGGAVVRLFLDQSQFNTAWKQSEASARSSAAKMEGSFSKVGVAANAAFMIAQAAVVAFIASGVRAAIEFEKIFQRIDAISNAEDDQLKAWKEGIVGISNTTARPVNELADALYFLSSSGLDATQVMAVLEASAQAAAVGLGSTADIARITSQALNAYAATGLTAVEVTDTLVAAVREGSADPEEFADALGRILPAAAAAGIGFDEVTASLAALSNIGLDVNEGVTAMRGLILALIAPTSKAAGAMADLGISTDEMRTMLKERGLLAALQELQRATGGNLDKMKAIVPNVRALTGALGITGQEARKVSDIFMETLDSTGDLATAMEEAAQGPAFKLEQGMNKLKNAGMEIGSALVPALVLLSKVLGWAADNFEVLLTLFLVFKASSWLPILLNTIAGSMVNMAVGSTAAATGMTVAATAAQGLGIALKTAFPWLILITGAIMALSAIAPPSKVEKITAVVKDARESVAKLAAEGENTWGLINDLTDEYAASLGNMTGMGTVVLSPEDEKKVENFRSMLIAVSTETKEAMETAVLSVQQFEHLGGSSLKALEPLTRLTGMSFREMTTQVKAALENTEDRTKAFQDLMADFMAKGEQVIEDWKNKTTESLDFVDDKFAELAGDGVGSISKIITQLEKSYNAQVKFNENLEIIAQKAKDYGVDASEMLQILIDQGPAAANTVAEIASSGEENFRRVNELLAAGRTNSESTTNALTRQVLGVLKSIEDVLTRIARRFNVTLAVDVKDGELNALMEKLRLFGIDDSRAAQLIRMRRDYGTPLAKGGVIAAATGIVSSPTYLVGEGSYGTRFGQGAELVAPLNEVMLSRLGAAIGQYTVQVNGGGGGNTTIVNVDAGMTSPLDVAQNIEWWRRTQGR